MGRQYLFIKAIGLFWTDEHSRKHEVNQEWFHLFQRYTGNALAIAPSTDIFPDS